MLYDVTAHLYVVRNGERTDETVPMNYARAVSGLDAVQAFATALKAAETEHDSTEPWKAETSHIIVTLVAYDHCAAKDTLVPEKFCPVTDEFESFGLAQCEDCGRIVDIYRRKTPDTYWRYRLHNRRAVDDKG